MPRTSRPRKDEPIRLVSTKSGPRYRVVIDTAPKGAPRRQVTHTFRTLSAAREYVAETRENMRRGIHVAPSRVTLRSLTDDWIKSRRDVRPITIRGYRTVLGPIVDHIGSRHAQSLTRDDVDDLVEWMRHQGGARGRGWSHRSTVYALGALRQVLAYGVEKRLLTHNPAAGVKAPRRTLADRREVEVWEVTGRGADARCRDLERFRETADADEWAAAWRLTLHGLRRSEVLGMGWESVDLTEGTVTVAAGRVVVWGESLIDEPKSDASARTIPVDDATVAALRRLSAQQAADRLAAGSAWQETGLVLVDALGRGVSPDVYLTRFAALCREAEVPVIPVHNVRHSLALLAHEHGVSPVDMATYLGHTPATHYKHYLPRTSQGIARAATVIGVATSAAR